MEPPPLAPHSPPNSKKRMFSGTVSGDALMIDADVVEIPPPVYLQSRASKQKAAVHHEIIDIDEDDSDDLMIIDVTAGSDVKGKKVVPATAGLNAFQPIKGHSQLQINGNGIGKLAPEYPLIEDLDLDEWFDDENAILQAHFDSMDIPTGVEATIPWWPASFGSKEQAGSASSSLHSSIGPFAKCDVRKTDQSQAPILDALKQPTKSLSEYPHGNKKPVTSPSSFHAHSQQSTSTYLANGIHPPKIQWEAPPTHGHHPVVWPHYANFLAANVPSSIHPMNNVGSYLAKDGMQQQIGAQLSGSSDVSGLNSFSMWWVHEYPVAGGSLYSSSFDPMQASYFSHQHNPSTRIEDEITVPDDLVSPSHGDTIESHILKKLEQFKKFDMVQDYSDHHYRDNKESSVKAPKCWAKKIQEEWKILEKDLPDTIFVRVYETRMDLLRAVIVGAEGTPYHDGIFFFDVYFPTSYPKVPPHVHYHAGGLRLNPNLYNCGKVCLSLLHTWSGDKQEKWIAGTSTMLQVLVSIQGLILNAKPYFNEPGYASSMGSAHGERNSKQYNENTFLLSLKTMLYSMRRPPKYFEDFVFGHFFKCAHDIMQACQKYLGGAEVGSIAKVDGVLQVKGQNTCSNTFRSDLQGHMKTLVAALKKIGVKDMEKYSIPLIEKDEMGSSNSRAATRKR